MLLLLLACDPASIDLGGKTTTDAALDSQQSDADTDTDTDTDTDADTDTDTGTAPSAIYSGEVSGQYMSWGANNTQTTDCHGSFTMNMATDNSFAGSANCDADHLSISGDLSGSFNNNLQGNWHASINGVASDLELMGGGGGGRLEGSTWGNGDSWQFQATFSGSLH